MINESLKALGFDRWFEQQVVAHDQHEIVRVLSVHKDRYVVSDGEQTLFAELSGHFLFHAETPLDFPTTGDWVTVQMSEHDSPAIIHGVLNRKTVLKRKTAGKQVDFQLIGANIDVAFVMQSANLDFNLSRLERYLVVVHEASIKPIVLLSKSDLVTKDVLSHIKQSIMSIASQVDVMVLSIFNDQDTEAFKRELKPGLTYCLLGSSGVGKTTLLNHLLGKEIYKTQAIRESDDKGKHTTTRRDLVHLPQGALLIDTPGMRELSSIAADAGIAETFSDIFELAQSCLFRDCSHHHEKGCAVLLAIKTGALSKKRYRNYIKMGKEATFNDMSYHEKRQRDKSFAKHVKSVVKYKRKR